jgi:hypothetical protein
LVGEKKFSIIAIDINGAEYEQLKKKIKEIKDRRKADKQKFITEKLGDKGALYFFKLKLKQLDGKTSSDENAILEGKDYLKLTDRELGEFTDKTDIKQKIQQEIKNFVMDTYPKSLQFNIIENLKPDYTFTHKGATLVSCQFDYVRYLSYLCHKNDYGSTL